jgi:hypothetical protein
MFFWQVLLLFWSNLARSLMTRSGVASRTDLWHRLAKDLIICVLDMPHEFAPQLMQVHAPAQSFAIYQAAVYKPQLPFVM